MPIKRFPKSRKRQAKSTVVAGEGTVPEAGGDAANPVEESKNSELSPNVIEASQAGSGAEKEITREIEDLKGNFEEVDNVVIAIMEMDVKVKEETAEDDQENCAGKYSIENDNLNSSSENVSENNSLVLNVEEILNLNGEFTVKNANLEMVGEIKCILNGDSIVVEEEKYLDVNGEGAKVEESLDDVVAVKNSNSNHENVVEEGKSLNISMLETPALNNNNLDANLEAKFELNAKGIDGTKNLDAVTDDDNLKSEERGELEGAKEADGTCASKLHSDGADVAVIGSEEDSVERETSAAKIKDMKSLGHTGENSSARNHSDRDGEFEKCEDCEEDAEDSEEDNEVDEDSPELFHDYLTDKKKQKLLEIYVGGLSEGVVEEDLIEVFGKFGELQAARLVKHPTTNKSKGFAFIQYATDEQAKNALSELKNGIEVKGKHVEISVSHDNDTLFVGNICKTWTKEHVVEKLKCYGIEHIEEIYLPDGPGNERKIKGFALLEFSTHSDAMAAFQRLRKPDVVFGHARSAKVAFARTPMHRSHEVLSQVDTVYIKGLTRSWDVKKLKEICKQYGEITEVRLPQNFRSKRRDFGFVTFASRESALACVEGINHAQFGQEMKVKAEIAKPHGKGHKKGAGGGFKANKECGKAAGLQMTVYAKSGKAKKESEMKGQAAEEKSDTLSKLKSNKEGEPMRLRYSVTEEQDVGVPSKAEKTDRKRKDLPRKASGRGKRERGIDYSNRTPEKQRGTIRGKESNSFRDTRTGPYLREGPVHGMVGQRMPHVSTYVAPGYVAFANSHLRHAQGAISASKRPISDMEPHAGYLEPYAGYLEPSKKQDRHHVQYLEPALGHQRQSHAGYIEPALRNQGQVHGRYRELALGRKDLPHAGYIEPAFGQHHFDASSYRLTRTGGYDGLDNQRPAYVGGSAVPPSYVSTYTSYAGYEHDGSVDGYYSSRGYLYR